MAPKRSTTASNYRASVEERAAGIRQQRQAETSAMNDQCRAQRERIVQHMNLVIQKGVDTEILDAEPSYKEQFTARNWMNLVTVPKAINEEIVREFYVAASPMEYRTRKIITFRGLNIRLGPAQINNYFRIPNPPDCPFGWSNDVEETPISTIFANLHKNGEAVNNLHVTYASVDANFWHLFVSDSLLPVGKQQIYNKERAKLVFAIMNNEPINVGQLVYSSILNALEVKANRAIVFPSLISQILKRHRVTVEGPGAVLIQPTVIKLQAINNQRNRKGVPKLLSARERARRDRSAGSGSNAGTSSVARGGRSQTSVEAAAYEDREAAIQEFMALSRELAESNRQLTEALLSDRANKEAEIARLREENVQLNHRWQEHESMYGTTYSRRPPSAGAGPSH